MKFASLLDIQSHNVISIDADALMLRLEVDGSAREVRLKPYHADILYALFSKHPSPLSYQEITTLLRGHNLVITDLTRMHRKLSEIRSFMYSFHPSLQNLIQNTRGVGYSLPLRLKNVHCLGRDSKVRFKNPKLTKAIAIIKGLIEDAMKLTAGNKIVSSSYGFVTDRTICRDVLAEKVSAFNKAAEEVLREIRCHQAELVHIRAEYLLAKLRTYIGLARISEYPISEAEWLDWFKQEVWSALEGLERLVKSAEI